MQFTGPTGANAVEAALKLARKVTGRRNVIAFTNGFHGVTMGSLAVTGNRHHRMGDVVSLPDVSRFPFDGYLGAGSDSINLLRTMLADPSSGLDTPAAIIVECVQGEGGLNVASNTWLQEISKLAAEQKCLLIVDDIQAGCGRTGTFFSFEDAKITPDIVVLAKSLSGFGLPFSAVLIRREHDIWQPAEHNGTFRGNAHAFVTGTVAIEKFWASGSFAHQIADSAAIVSQHLTRLSKLIPNSSVVGRGMMQGLNVGDGELASTICKAAVAQNLIIETSGPNGEVLKILAPLTTPLSLLNQGFDIIQSSIIQAMQQNQKEGKKANDCTLIS